MSQRLTDQAYQRLVLGIQALCASPGEGKSRWRNSDFVRHFYEGRGATVTTDRIGITGDVKRVADRVALFRPGGFADQIGDEAQRRRDGAFRIGFKNSYHEFGEIIYSTGGGGLEGEFSGIAISRAGSDELAVRYSGAAVIQYSDVFEDPASLIETVYGRSDSSRAPDWLRGAAQLGGRSYRIIGTWTQRFSGERTLPLRASLAPRDLDRPVTGKWPVFKKPHQT